MEKCVDILGISFSKLTLKETIDLISLKIEGYKNLQERKDRES